MNPVNLARLNQLYALADDAVVQATLLEMIAVECGPRIMMSAFAGAYAPELTRVQVPIHGEPTYNGYEGMPAMPALSAYVAPTLGESLPPSCGASPKPSQEGAPPASYAGLDEEELLLRLLHYTAITTGRVVSTLMAIKDELPEDARHITVSIYNEATQAIDIYMVEAGNFMMFLRVFSRAFSILDHPAAA